MYTLSRQYDIIMTTRDRTSAYLKFRVSARSRDAHRDTGVIGSAPNDRLLNSDVLALEEGRTKGESPAWMSLINDAYIDIESIKIKMKKLDGMHRRQLEVNFDSDDSNEYQIEANRIRSP